MAEAAGSEEPVVEQPAAGSRTDQQTEHCEQAVDEGKVLAGEHQDEFTLLNLREKLLPQVEVGAPGVLGA